LGLTPNEDGKLICANCGAEIPIPLAAPDESLEDSTTFQGDLPTSVDPPREAQVEADDSDESLEDSTTLQGDLPTAVDPPREGQVEADDSDESLLGDADGPRYAEQETIGHGGMGEIVLCVEHNTRREVAMKRMLPTAAKHPRQRARFVEEAQVTAQLEHPNIVPVHELGRDARGAIYFTMKLVKGRSLAEILALPPDGEETHSLGELLQIFLKVCDGVAFAHSRGVVHRDLKPANIMVGDFGEVLVMDWGIARILGHEEIVGEDDGTGVQSSRHDTDSPGLHTVAGSTMGSPSYMPPEQATGAIDKIDHRSDIYSLGAILYSILTLKRPVTGPTAEAIMNKVVRGNIHPPERRAPGRNIPRELSGVAMKCLAKYRRDRYASVPDLQRDVNLYLEGRSVSAAPDTFAQALVKLVKRNKPVSVSIAAAAVILIAVVSVAFIRVTGAMQRAIRGEQQAVTAQQEQRATALAASERFAMQAIRAAETGRPEEALRRVTDAETVALHSPWGPYARGMFARTNKDYPAAVDLFRKALEIDPAHAKSNVALSETLLRMGDLDQAQKLLAGISTAKDWRALLNVGQTLYDTRRWEDSQVVFKRAVELMEKEKDASTGVRLATAKEVQAKIDEAQRIIDLARSKSACAGFADEIKDLPADEQVKLVRAKFEEVNGEGVKIAVAEVRDGRWIRALLPPKTRFLEPLRGLQLQELITSGTKVSDLEPLKGMPLTHLNCRSTLVNDLAPLSEGMPLTFLSCYGTFVSSLEPLKGMRLKELDCGGTKVTDLSPLKGMPLERLNLQSVQVNDLEVLKGMPLVRLHCFNMPITDLSPLKGMLLTYLSVARTKIFDLSPLKGMPLTNLDLQATRVTDLTTPKGMELEEFTCSGTEITDLGPLKGMQLRGFKCANSKIGDLSVLKGMPLIWLHCNRTQVSDLRPLEGAPLEVLVINNTKVTDLTPLVGMKLETLSFTPKNITRGIEIIRGMKTIERFSVTDRYGAEQIKPDDFWKRYDAGEFK
jgi:serine/threonine protein kinase